MSYKKLDNGLHHWNFRLGGRNSPRKKITTADFRAGEREVRRLIYEYEHGLASGDPGRGLTFDDLCLAYLKDKSQGAKKQRQKTLLSHLKDFHRNFPACRLAYLNSKTSESYNAVDKWIKAYRESKNRLGGPIKEGSIRRKFNTLRAMFNWAIRRGLMRDNPCSRVVPPAVGGSLPRFLSQDEINSLFKNSPRPAFTNYCTIVLNTGMRPGEVLALQVPQIDLDRRVMAGFEQKNRKGMGVVRIKDSLVRPLKEMIGERKEGPLLNYTAAQLRKDAEKTIEKAGINNVTREGTAKFTIYGLRHTFASHLLMAGEDMATVARWLRNGIGICFKHYGHLTDKYMIDAANKIDLVPRQGVELPWNSEVKMLDPLQGRSPS